MPRVGSGYLTASQRLSCKAVDLSHCYSGLELVLKFTRRVDLKMRIVWQRVSQSRSSWACEIGDRTLAA